MLEEGHPLFVRFVPLEKISSFLLSQKTAKSFSRYKFFTTYGFHPDDPDRLVDAIYHHPETGLITQLPVDAFGQRWIIVGPIVTPDGRNPVIRTGWIKHGSGSPRFVTAIPKAG